MAEIRTILIANRGEIAVRIQRTARAMGVATVVVFSDEDADSPAVKLADRAVRIGPAPSSESYLRIDRIVEAAQRTGADAVHPGFGFLAENADFAQACRDAGLVFIGPPPSVIRAMGSKQEAKRIVAGLGVPVVPGFHGGEQSADALAAAARFIGFPLLIKASAGGGGKGMRILRSADELEPAIEAAKREALGAFGDATLILEKYVERPRHVEIQILGDQHGNIVHLFERECSIQRRHQKIIEETPSPALDAALRDLMGQAAVTVARAVGYENAGTVEFILAPDGKFYFLEVNTRLQVEHPVTECVTGIDLVREQIRIARGERLAFSQAELSMRGAAVECRLYAEDPDAGFLPQSGKIVDFFLPELPGLRVDSGVETGSQVGIHYDPMLAKIITHAMTRAEAVQRMVRALSELSVQGIRTNRELLIRVLSHPEFSAGNTHTHFIEDHIPPRASDENAAERARRAAIAITLFAFEMRRRGRRHLPSLTPGFRNNRFAPQWVEYLIGEQELRVDYESREASVFDIDAAGMVERVRLVSCEGPSLALLDGAGVRHKLRIVADGDRWFVHALDGCVMLVEKPRFPPPEIELQVGACVAPMPGRVVQVLAEEGRRVAAGDVLVILEAMKMEHPVVSSQAGVVTRVLVTPGEQVAAAAVLAVVEPS